MPVLALREASIALKQTPEIEGSFRGYAQGTGRGADYPDGGTEKSPGPSLDRGEKEFELGGRFRFGVVEFELRCGQAVGSADSLFPGDSVSCTAVRIIGLFLHAALRFRARLFLTLHFLLPFLKGGGHSSS